MNDRDKMRRGARELVERARVGDQNAMGMLATVAQNARRGSPRAQTAFGMVQEYIRAHPVERTSSIGAEGAGTIAVLKEPTNPPDRVLEVLCGIPFVGDELLIEACCVVLSQGPPWNKPRIRAVDAQLDGDAAKNLFRFGVGAAGDESKLKPVARQLPPDAIGILCAGHCIGTARKIQLVRLRQVPSSVLSPEVGWELGHG